MLFDRRRSPKLSRRNMLKAATGAAAGMYAFGIPGKSYQRTLAQESTLAEILAIPGAGLQPSEADMERVGELCLRSTKPAGAFAGQTVTFIGLKPEIGCARKKLVGGGLAGFHVLCRRGERQRLDPRERSVRAGPGRYAPLHRR